MDISIKFSFVLSCLLTTLLYFICIKCDRPSEAMGTEISVTGVHLLPHASLSEIYCGSYSSSKICTATHTFGKRGQRYKFFIKHVSYHISPTRDATDQPRIYAKSSLCQASVCSLTRLYPRYIARVIRSANLYIFSNVIVSIRHINAIECSDKFS